MRMYAFSAACVVACAIALFLTTYETQNQGPRAAYEAFKKETFSLSFDERHTAAHRMGAELFDALGPDGFAICDETFDFGCYHGFFARAVATRGLSVVPEFAAACRQTYPRNSSPCEHGIGHGIMEHTGRAQLEKALELCALTGQQDPLHGCTSGVFMENNSAMLFDGDTVRIDVRTFDEARPYEPCDTLTEMYRPSCYFEQSLWWLTVLGEDFAHIGALCAGVEGRAEQDACFVGWGINVAEKSERNASKAEALCALINDHRGESLCRLGVVQRFLWSDELRAEAKRMCENLDTQFRPQCAFGEEGV